MTIVLQINKKIAAAEQQLNVLRVCQRQCYLKNKKKWDAKEEDCQDINSILICGEEPDTMVEKNLVQRYENNEDQNEEDLVEWDKAYVAAEECERELKHLRHQRLEIMKRLDAMKDEKEEEFDDTTSFGSRIDMLREHNEIFGKELKKLQNEIQKKKKTVDDDRTSA